MQRTRVRTWPYSHYDPACKFLPCRIQADSTIVIHCGLSLSVPRPFFFQFSSFLSASGYVFFLYRTVSNFIKKACFSVLFLVLRLRAPFCSTFGCEKCYTMNPDKPHGRKRQSSKHLFHVHLVPDQILVVKYGAGIRVTETQTQIMIRKHLKDQVPVPEVFGWTEDEGQVFIYMLMIEGVTLQERWVSMSEDGRRVVCEELRDMVKGWRSLEQDGHEPYVRKFFWQQDSSRPRY